MKLKILKIKKCYVTQKWVNWLNDKKVTKYSINRFKKHTIETQKIFLSNKLKEKNSILFKIYLNERHIGLIEISKIDKIKKNCYISYFVGEKLLWSKGIGKIIIKKIKFVVFRNLKLNKIYAGVYSNNLASINILKYNNFKFSSSVKNFYKFENSKVDKITLKCSRL